MDQPNNPAPQKPVFVPKPPEPGDWDIGNFYSNAFRIAKSFKTLWILGLIFGAAGGGCSFQFPLGGGGGPSFNPPSASPNPETTNKVLGAASNIYTESIPSVFSNIPHYIFLILGIEVILFIALWFLISYLKSAYAYSSTIVGTQKALEGQKLTLSEISTLSLPKTISVLKLSAISLLIIIPTALATLAIIGLSFVNKAFLFTIPILIFAGIIAIAIWTLTFTFAIRALVLENATIKQSIKTGFFMAKKKFLMSIVLGILNSIVSSFVLLIPLGILNALLGILGLLVGLPFHKSLLLGGIFLGFGIFSSVIFIAPIIMSMIVIGKTAVWNQAYLKTKELMHGK